MDTNMQALGTGANLAQNYSQAEADAFQAFSEAYEKKHPVPVPPETSRLFSMEYWDFWAVSLVGASAILLTAIRTGFKFYSAAYKDMQIIPLSILEAFLAVMAIDLGLPIVTAVSSYRRLLKADIESVEMSKVKMWIASVLTIAIVILAGVGQSLKIDSALVQQYAPFVDKALVLLMGGGAGIIAAIYGDMLGERFSFVRIGNERKAKAYLAEQNEYERARAEAWKESDQFNSLRLQYQQMDQSHRRMIRQNYGVTQGVTGVTQSNKTSNADLAFNYLDTHPDKVYWFKSEDMPSAREIAKELNINPASAQRGRERWIKANTNEPNSSL